MGEQMHTAKHTISAHAKQSLKRRVLKALIDREMTITELAKRVRKNRNTVSRTIHRFEFPHVARLICEELQISCPPL